MTKEKVTIELTEEDVRQAIADYVDHLSERSRNNVRYPNGLQSEQGQPREINRSNICIMEWINVTDRLPELGTLCILFFESKECSLTHIDVGSLEWVDNISLEFRTPLLGLRFKYGHVTHWMPAPEPPKK